VPYLETKYNASELEKMQKEYESIQSKFHALAKEKKILSYMKDMSTIKTFEIGKDIYVDFRIMEMQIPEIQDQVFDCSILMSIPTHESLYPFGESFDNVIERVKAFVHEVNKKHQGQTILMVTHAEPATVAKKVFKDFDYLAKRDDYIAHNKTLTDYTPNIRYRDNDRNTQVDLHKPYIDNYRFKK